ncbi:MAG: hypothetical protein LBS75_03255 [Synergistaceae bacterium]|jgi:predicted transposase/invertase (TIGR01784 family)|nr:hypothetical protein [Synergistaceae bacterium]
MLATKTEEMKMTVGRLKRLSEDERARMLFEARELYLMDEAARRDAAVAEGEARGRAEGEARGKFELARTMLADGLPTETIKKYTGLDESAILSLR